MTARRLLADRIASPLGDLFAAVDEAGALVLLDFVGAKDRARDERGLERRFADQGFQLEWSPQALRAVRAELEEYFDGSLTEFTTPIAPMGTRFQMQVWEHLRHVPYGATVSYAELAKRVGRPGAARAVGRANATNPIAIVVPCHRVIGASGDLTGYAGGVKRKQALLALESSGPAVRDGARRPDAATC